MALAPIAYDLTDADRRGLSVSFGVAIEKVPTRVTGGNVNDVVSGVTFVEMIGGHRIALRFEGRPTLSRAAAPAMVDLHRKVA